MSAASSLRQERTNKAMQEIFDLDIYVHNMHIYACCAYKCIPYVLTSLHTYSNTELLEILIVIHSRIAGLKNQTARCLVCAPRWDPWV